MGLRQNHFVAVVSHSITSSEMERAAPPIRLINSRRFIAAPDTNAQDRRSKAFGKGLPMSALGQKRTHEAMAALPPIADMCSAITHVRFGPIADSCNAAIDVSC